MNAKRRALVAGAAALVLLVIEIAGLALHDRGDRGPQRRMVVPYGPEFGGPFGPGVGPAGPVGPGGPGGGPEPFGPRRRRVGPQPAAPPTSTAPPTTPAPTTTTTTPPTTA